MPAPATRPGSQPHVLVLGGGPDAERQVSLTSAACVAEALKASNLFRVTPLTIDRLTTDQLRAHPADVIFPVLHGGWGEGGPLQEVLEQDGRPFVSSGSRAARTAMDKIATKAIAARLGIPTPPVHILDTRDNTCPLDLPVIIKPVHEGSTIGLYVVTTQADWRRALEAIRNEASRGTIRSYMIEPKVGGNGKGASSGEGTRGGRARELTVGLIDNAPLPTIEIIPADGLYDYEAKYHRDDTRYTLDPSLPPGVDQSIKQHSVALAKAIGIRHLARADFMLDHSGTPWLLEINTIPGFTTHSLVPMAARHTGQEMPALCAKLVQLALRDR